jgi:hypothetical protein
MDRNERFLRQVDVGAELTLSGNKLANQGGYKEMSSIFADPQRSLI